MKKTKLVLKWIGWILLIQFILINISAALYADKFTRLYTAKERAAIIQNPPASNLFAKTWRLFTGYKFYKNAEEGYPSFPYSTIHFATAKKIPIEAWYGKADSSKGTVILFHGLMGNKSFVLQQAKKFFDRGYNVLLPDTRGHGNSGGNRTSFGFYESEEVKMAFDYVKSLGEQRIYMWGISMGAVEIMKSVADNNLDVKGLMLEMPFGSLQSHVKARLYNMKFPRQPLGYLITFWIGVENGFDGIGFTLDKYAKKIKCPVLFQYGANDQLVSMKETTTVYNAFPSPNKKLVIYQAARHESLLNFDKLRWENEVDEFLESIVL